MGVSHVLQLLQEPYQTGEQWGPVFRDKQGLETGLLEADCSAPEGLGPAVTGEAVWLCPQGRQEAPPSTAVPPPPPQEAWKTVQRRCLLCHLFCPNRPLCLFPYSMWGRGGTCPPLGVLGWLGAEVHSPHHSSRGPQGPAGFLWKDPQGSGRGCHQAPLALLVQVSSSVRRQALWPGPGPVSLSTTDTRSLSVGPSWALAPTHSMPGALAVMTTGAPRCCPVPLGAESPRRDHWVIL